MIGADALVPPKTSQPLACVACRRRRRRCPGRRPRRRRRRCAARSRCRSARTAWARSASSRCRRRVHTVSVQPRAARSRRQRGAADRGDVLRGRRELDAVAAVAGADRDRHAGVVVVRLSSRGLGGVLAAAVAVRDRRWRPARRPGRPRRRGWRRSWSWPRRAGSCSSGRSPMTMSRSSEISSAQPALAAGSCVPPLWLTFLKQPLAVVQARQAELACGRRPGRPRRWGRRRRRRSRRLAGRRRSTGRRGCTRSGGRPGRSRWERG